MKPELLSILIAFGGYSLHNVGQAIQKIGLDRKETDPRRGWLIWAAGTGATPLAPLVILYAVSIGNVALVGAMAGSGIASLTLFSMLVMHEEVHPRELWGVGIILSGLALVGIFSMKEGPTSEILLNWLYIYSGGITVASGSFLLIVLKTSLRGLFIGGIAGAIGGLQPLFQKLSTSSIGQAHSILARHPGSTTAQAIESLKQGSILRQIALAFTNPYSLIWIAISIIPFLILQPAYRRDKAIRIVPTFSAGTVLIPLIGGIFIFHSPIHPVQWPGIAMIFGGMLLISLSRGARLDPGEMESRPGGNESGEGEQGGTDRAGASAPGSNGEGTSVPDTGGQEGSAFSMTGQEGSMQKTDGQDDPARIWGGRGGEGGTGGGSRRGEGGGHGERGGSGEGERAKISILEVLHLVGIALVFGGMLLMNLSRRGRERERTDDRQNGNGPGDDGRSNGQAPARDG